jgi:hypothetical protein
VLIRGEKIVIAVGSQPIRFRANNDELGINISRVPLYRDYSKIPALEACKASSLFRSLDICLKANIEVSTRPAGSCIGLVFK